MPASCSRTSRRTRSARTSTRRRSRRRSASPSASSRTCCPCAAACSRPVTCGRPTTCAPLLEAAYATSNVVRVLPEGVVPELARVQHTDGAEVALFEDGATGRAIVVCALDNLGKGAAGQAVQNANLALGLDETAGLRLSGSARMSVTAAKGFVASGVHCGIRKKDASTSRSCARLVPATGAGMFTREPRAGGAGASSAREHLELAEPQAVVINSGVANAATGERGELDARATAAEAARLLGLDAEEVLVLSTGVIGAPLPLANVLAGSRSRGDASPDGGADAAEAIMTTDTHAKEAVAHGAGFTVGGMAKGSGMIHPKLATMLAVVTTDYPLEPGEAIEFLRPAVDASFNAISVDGECSTNDAVILLANGASGVERTASDAQFAACAAQGLRRAREADRRRRRGRDRARRDRGHGRGERRARRARSPSASRRRRSSRLRSSATTRTGAASPPRQARRSSTAASRSSTPTCSRSRSTASPVLVAGAADRRRAGADERPLRDRARPRARRRRRDVPDERPLLRLRQDQRGLPDVSVVLKVGGASTGGVAEASPRSTGRRVRRARRGPADLGGDGRGAGSSREFVDGRRVTTRGRARGRARELRRGQRGRLRGDRAARGAALGDEIGLEARHVAGARPRRRSAPVARRAAVLEALAAGRVPVVSPLARGPLNVNADEVAVGARRRARRASGSASSPTFPASIRDGELVALDRRRPRRDARRRRRLRRRDRPEAARRGARRAERRRGRHRRDGGGRMSVADRRARCCRRIRAHASRSSRARARWLVDADGPRVPRLRRRHRRRRARPPPPGAARRRARAARPALARLEPLRDRAGGRARRRAVASASAARRRSSATPAPRRTRPRSSTRARRPASRA